MKKLLVVAAMAYFCASPGFAADDIVLEAFELRLKGQINQAKNNLVKVVKENPNNHRANFELARLELTMMGAEKTSMTVKQRQEHMKSCIKNAKKAIKAAIKASPENAEYHYLAGIVMTFDSIYDMHKIWTMPAAGITLGKSLKHLENAIELDPNHYNAKVLLSGYYERLPWYLGGSKSKARKYQPQPDEKGNTDMQIKNKALISLRLAEKHRRTERYDKAKEVFSEIVSDKNAPNIFKAYAMRQLAKIDLKDGNSENAEKKCNEADKLDPERVCADSIFLQDLLSGLFDRGDIR